MLCAVAIIAHSSRPSANEQASYEQCLAVLGAHPLLLVCPESLDITLYTELAAQREREITAVRFPDTNFQSVATYNRLMLSPGFYRRFDDYKYVLIYQLDAWVFRDELALWCGKGYAYIGAPFFTDRGEILPFAGNGGFSLRRIKSFLGLLESTSTTAAWNYNFFLISFPAKTRLRAYVKQFLHIASLALCRLSPRLFCTSLHSNEDMLYARAFSLIDERFVAPPSVAAFFAFERFPEKTYRMTGGQLPFGWHAYGKYAMGAWAHVFNPNDRE